jgi:3-oxoacyl-[acyl-carrier protein] reductase
METGRRVLVTGGSRGIGAAVVREFAALGDRVAVHCRADVELASALIASLPGSGHVVGTADLADNAALAAMVDSAAASLGGLDVLVHCAGIYTELPIAAASYEEWNAYWRTVVEVNLLGAAAVAHRFVHHLLARPGGPAGGRIVLVGSRGAYRGEPAAPAYGASKAGLHSLAQSLAVALAPYEIAVAGVAPGFIRTDMTGEILAGPAGDAIRAQSPYNRVGEPAEVAAAIAFLAGPGATWTTGTILDVNGASYLR